MKHARMRMSYPIYTIFPNLLDECKSIKTSKTEKYVPYLFFIPVLLNIKNDMLPMLSFYPCSFRYKK